MVTRTPSAPITPVRIPRGIRLNNPGNIRHGIDWQGDEPEGQRTDAEFDKFDAPVWGLRALMRTLLTYRRKHGLRTVGAIVGRWAPARGRREDGTTYVQDTSAYAAHVARRLGVEVGGAIDVENRATLIALARAITRHENGRPPASWPDDWYDDATYAAAADLALGLRTTVEV